MDAELVTVPDQRRTASRKRRYALHRIRETR
jgi:hypothetical protein